MSKYEDLVAKLREIFQIDRPDLDFGVYRVLNARADEINEYLSKRLKERVAEALMAGASDNAVTIKAELAKAEKSAEELDVDPASLPKVKKLKADLAAAMTGGAEHENQVFSHLLTFFSRYYDKGDFISQRRYKGDTYAIPYSGEEVVLHWANRDQYYIKSGESFSNYSFKLDDGRSVHFRLVAADTAKDNRKDNDKERRFMLAEARTVARFDDDGEPYEETIDPVSVEDGELIIRFDYGTAPKGTKQDKLVEDAVAAVLADDAAKTKWVELAKRAPTEKKPQRTLLEKHLTTYTQKNTADYFIHKDLGPFLRRELDFYIKNEVMHLDDVQNAEAFAAIEKNLRMIQCLRAIAQDLITFLASIEDFQKKLWLKRKFVVAAEYCVTLDRLPEALYPAIAANDAQWAQWHDLGMRESAEAGSVDDLKAQQFLMIDTNLFDAGFKAELLRALPDLDANTDGLLVHGDNFQALTLLQKRYRGQVKCLYNDPPYNTKANEFPYKDSYKHSSWITMMDNRVRASLGLLRPDAVLFHHIDENEHQSLSTLISDIVGEKNRAADIIWKNSSKNGEDYVSAQHEYIVCAVLSKEKNGGQWKERKEGLEEIYRAFEGFLKKHGEDWDAIHAEALKFYGELADANPIKDSKHYGWMDETGVYFPDNISKPANGYYYDILHPVTGKPCKKPAGGWRFIESTMKDKIANNDIHFGKDHTTVPNNKTYLKNTEEQSLTSIKYKDGRVASNLLKAMFGHSDAFKNPKDVDLTARLLKSVGTEAGIVLDAFAGSGTTGHAIVNLKRSASQSNYILLEQGWYFETVLKPRVMKATYSASWSEGLPTSPETGVSQAFKVLKIESYEDALNNLTFARGDGLQNLLEGFKPEAKDDYLMRYMLDVESKGSLLSVDDFQKPFDYTLKITVDSAGAFETRKVDLVETFSYLIGLRVSTVDQRLDKGYALVTGTLPTGERTMVVWRDCEVIGYEALTALFDSLGLVPGQEDYDLIYVNGDHNVPSVLVSKEDGIDVKAEMSLRRIEPVFLDAMFNVDDV